jgi:integrase
MTRRGAREGTIRQRPDGRWEARWRAGDGRQRSIYGVTRKDVQDRLRKALEASDNGIKPVDGRLTTGGYLEAWIRDSVRPRLRVATAHSYGQVVDLYVVPQLGRIPLAKLEPADVARMLASLSAREDRPLSSTTVRYVYTVLRIALGRALRQGLVVRNVATLVDPPAKARHELRPLTAAEASAFLEAVRGDRLEALYVMAIALGLRQGELLGLRWSDVDLEAGAVAIRRQLQSRTRTDAEPKTDRARRTLALPAFVVTALREHRARQAERRFVGADGYVFATRNGTPLMARNVVREFKAALKRTGLAPQRFHDLRHAAATLMLEQGEDLDAVSRILGHASVATTADVYAHLTAARMRRAADRMDALLGRARTV